MVLLAVLVYLAVGASSALLIARVVASQPQPPGPSHIHDVYEAAFLSGGPARVTDAALAAMHSDGRLIIGGPGIVLMQHGVAHDPVERAVIEELAAAPTGALHTLRLSVMRGHAVQEIGHGLAARGLMVAPGQNRSLVTWGVTQGTVSALAIPLSFLVTIATFTTEGPFDSGPPFIVMVVPALFAGLVIGFLQAGRAKIRVSRAGKDALRACRAQFAQAYSAAPLVALHGLHALPDPRLQAQLTAAARVQVRRGSAGGSSSDGSSGAYAAATVWCAGASPGSGCGGSSCGSSSGGGSSGGSGCGGSSGGGSSCGGSSSGGSSCGGSSSGGSSCGGGGGSS